MQSYVYYKYRLAAMHEIVLYIMTDINRCEYPLYNSLSIYDILFMILLYSISTIYQSKIELNTCIYICDLLKNELDLLFLSYNVKECSTITDTPKMWFLCTFVLICCLIMSPFVILCLYTSITASQYTIALVSSFR